VGTQPETPEGLSGGVCSVSDGTPRMCGLQHHYSDNPHSTIVTPIRCWMQQVIESYPDLRSLLLGNCG
jgi:hypothetical protein